MGEAATERVAEATGASKGAVEREAAEREAAEARVEEAAERVAEAAAASKGAAEREAAKREARRRQKRQCVHGTRCRCLSAAGCKATNFQFQTSCRAQRFDLQAPQWAHPQIGGCLARRNLRRPAGALRTIQAAFRCVQAASWEERPVSSRQRRTREVGAVPCTQWSK